MPRPPDFELPCPARTPAAPARAPRAGARSALAPLGALAAGFGIASLSFAQTAPQEPAGPAPGATLPTVTIHGNVETQGKDAYQATTTTLGKGKQELRDIPQSVTVITEKLMDDRQQDTLKGALHGAAGIAFEAAEGGTIGDNIRIRGFPARGDIYIDGMRDIAQYNRDTFNLDRLEILRGSASMLFGRGSTGGVINQVNKMPFGIDRNDVSLTVGSGDSIRLLGDFNKRTGENSALRVNVMGTSADNWGAETRRRGIAPTYRFGIGTANEFTVGLYHLSYDDIPNYGVGWVDGKMADISAKNYYGMASDYQDDSATYGFLSYIHRFEGGSEWKTTLRHGRFKRDLWASTIRVQPLNAENPDVCTTPTVGGAPPGPGVPRVPAVYGPITNDTVLCRGNQNRAGDDEHTFLQSDFTTRQQWFGLRHDLMAGIDVSREESDRYGYTGALQKPNTTVDDPDDGATIPDTRVRELQTRFKATAIGAYVQDVMQLTPTWKLVGGVRYDRFKGDYWRTEEAGGSLERTDGLWSKRIGVLYQPSLAASFHVSYGTSFNTSGDLYQYDDLSANTPPEKSRNFEIGAKFDLYEGNLSIRTAIFRTEKYNERNTDAESASPDNYLLSGKRHASGVEFDVAGRITPRWEAYLSYAWIPDVHIDRTNNTVGNPPVPLEGTRPGLTPRHSGSVWTSYQVTQRLRVGAGANAMGARTPAEGSLEFHAPQYVSYDAMAQYDFNVAYVKLNLINLTDKLYADQVYRGHIIAGQPRTVLLTVGAKF